MLDKSISVIIPTYNRSIYLTRAIDSVLACSANCEIIVVDDNGIGSDVQIENEKKLKHYINKHNVKYIKHKKNLNGAAARNTGVMHSSFEYITFLDDDDEFCNDRITEIFNKIAEHDYDFLFTNTIVKRNNGSSFVFKPVVNYDNVNDLIYETLCQNSFIRTGSNMVCKKSLFNKIDGFDVSFTRNQDIEFLVRYLSQCKSIGYINKELVIKNEIDYMNVPKLDKYIKIKEKFLSKYASLIEQFPDDKKHKIYKLNYYELLKLSFIDNDIVNRKVILKKLIDYKVFDLYLYLKYFTKFSLVYLRNKFIYKR